MGLLSKVASVAGKVVSGVGGDRGRKVVHQARSFRDKVRGEAEPDEESGPLPWPASVAPGWDRGHDLLSNQWPTGATTLLNRWVQVGKEIEAQWSPVVGSASTELSARWVADGETFVIAWRSAGADVASAWEEALGAPDAVAAEGILDGSIQSGWRHIREAWIPVRLGVKDSIQSAGKAAGLDAATVKAAQAEVEAVWSVTETELSDRFLDGGGYLVSLVREVADGQSHPAELLDTIQQMLAQQDSTWTQSMDGFSAAWKAAAEAVNE